MRCLLALTLVASAIAFAAGDPHDLSYTITIAGVPDSQIAAIYSALNGPPRWTHEHNGMQLPSSLSETAHYTDIEPDSDAVWFGFNVPPEWLTMSATTPYFWGNLNSMTKWSPGPAYAVQGGRYEIIPNRENFTDSSSLLDCYIMINRPDDSRMQRYRLNFGANGPKWYWFGTGMQFWTGEMMTGEPDVYYGQSYPVVKRGDKIAVVIRVSAEKMVEYAGKQIKSAFKIGGSRIEQVIHVPEIP